MWSRSGLSLSTGTAQERTGSRDGSLALKFEGTADADSFNEDDHFDFEKPRNNFVAAIGEFASWGYFDYRMKGEGFDEGYQSVPVNWKTSSERKKGFFKLLGEIAGEKP